MKYFDQKNLFSKISSVVSLGCAVSRRVLGWQPFTFRGVVALILSVAAIEIYAIPQKDLAAALLGGSIGFLVVLLGLGSIVLRFSLRRALTAEATFESNALSHRPVAAGLILRSSTIAPFFALAVQRAFEKNGVSSPKHIARGKDSESGLRYLLDDVWFPHRGVWNLTGLDLTVTDVLGFSSLSWRLPCFTSVEVAAPNITIKTLPIVSASSRAGDQLNLSAERSGDLYDIKPYDPSDGTKRILWKTFAKSGQLVVRRPEPAIVPEGEVAVYLIAEREDDHVAGALQDYIRQLDQQGVKVLFGTDGDDSLAQATEQSTLGFEPSATQILRTINSGAWSPKAGSGADFNKYLDCLCTGNRSIHEVILFTNEEAAKFALANGPVAKAAAHAGTLNIGISVVMVPDVLKGRLITNGEPYSQSYPFLGKQTTRRGFLHRLGKKSEKVEQSAKNFVHQVFVAEDHEVM